MYDITSWFEYRYVIVHISFCPTLKQTSGTHGYAILYPQSTVSSVSSSRCQVGLWGNGININCFYWLHVRVTRMVAEATRIPDFWDKKFHSPEFHLATTRFLFLNKLSFGAQVGIYLAGVIYIYVT